MSPQKGGVNNHQTDHVLHIAFILQKRSLLIVSGYGVKGKKQLGATTQGPGRPSEATGRDAGARSHPPPVGPAEPTDPDVPSHL